MTSIQTPRDWDWLVKRCTNQQATEPIQSNQLTFAATSVLPQSARPLVSPRQFLKMGIMEICASSEQQMFVERQLPASFSATSLPSSGSKSPSFLSSAKTGEGWVERWREADERQLIVTFLLVIWLFLLLRLRRFFLLIWKSTMTDIQRLLHVMMAKIKVEQTEGRQVAFYLLQRRRSGEHPPKLSPRKKRLIKWPTVGITNFPKGDELQRLLSKLLCSAWIPTTQKQRPSKANHKMTDFMMPMWKRIWASLNIHETELLLSYESVFDIGILWPVIVL